MELGTAIGLLFVIMATFAFEGLVFGEELAEESFGEIEESTPGACSDNNFGCIIDFISDLFSSIVGAVAFLFNLLTFNIPDAPWWIRLVLVGVVDGGAVLLIVSILRGN